MNQEKDKLNGKAEKSEDDDGLNEEEVELEAELEKMKGKNRMKKQLQNFIMKHVASLASAQHF